MRLLLARTLGEEVRIVACHLLDQGAVVVEKSSEVVHDRLVAGADRRQRNADDPEVDLPQSRGLAEVADELEDVVIDVPAGGAVISTRLPAGSASSVLASDAFCRNDTCSWSFNRVSTLPFGLTTVKPSQRSWSSRMNTKPTLSPMAMPTSRSDRRMATTVTTNRQPLRAPLPPRVGEQPRMRELEAGVDEDGRQRRQWNQVEEGRNGDLARSAAGCR